MMDNELYHHGVLGMRWGVRNADTKARYERQRTKAEEKYVKNQEKIQKFEKRLRRNKRKMVKASRAIPTEFSVASFKRNHRATYRNRDKIDKLNKKNEKLVRRYGTFLGLEYGSKRVSEIENRVSSLDKKVEKYGLTDEILKTTIPEIDSLMAEYTKIKPQYEKYKFGGKNIHIPYKTPRALR